MTNRLTGSVTQEARRAVSAISTVQLNRYVIVSMWVDLNDENLQKDDCNKAILETEILWKYLYSLPGTFPSMLVVVLPQIRVK